MPTTTSPDRRAPHVPRRGVARAMIAAALGAVLIAGCGKSDPPDKAKGPAGAGGGAMMALPVSVIEAKKERIPVLVEAVGQAEGSKEVEVRARVGGILVKQAFKEGDRVQAGAVLYTVDRAPFDIALAQAEAALAQQKALIEKAQREAARLKPLVQERAISAREYDDATSAVETNQAQLAASESKVKEARLNLSYTNVTAPISGVTGRSQRSEGSLVAAGTDLLTTISVTDPIWARFSLSEAETLQLRKAPQSATVRLVLSDGSLYDRTGKLNFAASTVDLKTGLVPLRAEFPNRRLIILPGQFARVQITLGSREGVLVPKPAISQSDRGNAAFVVGPDNKVVPRPVETDGWSGDNWVVTKGLENGDKVIVDNLMKLRPGAPVAPHPVGQAPAGSPSPGAPGAQPKDAAGSKGTGPADKAPAAPGGSAAPADGKGAGGATAPGKK